MFERDDAAQIVEVGEEQLIEAWRSTIEDAEAVSAWVHLQEWLDLAIDRELVAEDAVEVEQVEENLTVRVEHFVGQDHRDVEVAAW